MQLAPGFGMKVKAKGRISGIPAEVKARSLRAGQNITKSDCFVVEAPHRASEVARPQLHAERSGSRRKLRFPKRGE